MDRSRLEGEGTERAGKQNRPPEFRSGGLSQIECGSLLCEKIRPASVRAAVGLDGQVRFLDKATADEPADGVALPTRSRHDLFKTCSLWLAQQFQHLCLLRAL